MRLHRLEIASFRKLRGPVVLDGLGEPLVVISGDNEEGKSTVLLALKAALFEHHTVGGAVRDEMTPYDGGTPEVAVEFEIGGRRYQLRKAFRRGGVRLESAAARLSDDAAERRLGELLRFERRQGRSEPGPRFQGLQGLFWLDQGTSFAVQAKDDPVTLARDRIAAAIASEVGTAPDNGFGRQLLDRVKAQCNRFWTEKAWRETGELERAKQGVKAIEEALAPLRERHREAEERCDRLARLKAERRRAVLEDELGAARQRHELARARMAEVERLQLDRNRARDRRRLAEAELALIEARGQERARRREALARLAREETALAAGRAELQDMLAGGERALHAAQAEESRAAAAVVAAETEERRLARLLARRERQAALDQLEAGLRAALSADEAAREAAAELALNPATPERLKEVRERHARRQLAQAALDAAATRLEFHPDPGAEVRCEGRAVDLSRPLRLSEAAELELVGFGRMAVLPGGTDIAERRSRVVAAEQALRDALVEAGADDLAALEARAETRRRADERRRSAGLELAASLRAAGVASLADLTCRRDLLLRELDGLAGEETEAERVLDDRALALRAEAARRVVADARAALEAARSTVREAEQALSARRLDEARQEQQLVELARQRSTAHVALAADEDAEPEGVLAAALEAARDARDQAASAEAELERALEAADPETVRERLAIAERAVREEEAAAGRREQAIRDLEVDLRARGDEGTGERLAEGEEALARAQAEEARLRREARAWRLLHDELAGAEAERRQALVEPVLTRIRPWLSRLFPAAEPVLDGQSFALAELRRGAVSEPCHRLSVGTREQLAVLVRLGLAQLLLEREGEAPCLILDDALVYADEGRFEAMKAILQRASRQLQIIILTCRPRDYRGLEARLLRLEECQT